MDMWSGQQAMVSRFSGTSSPVPGCRGCLGSVRPGSTVPRLPSRCITRWAPSRRTVSRTRSSGICPIANAVRLTLALLLLLAVAPLTAQPVPAPTGWTVSHAGTNWIYTPSGLPSGQTFTLTLEPTQSLGGQDIDVWLAAHARADATRRGTLNSPPTTTQHGIARLTFRDTHGAQWIALYTAVPQP